MLRYLKIRDIRRVMVGSATSRMCRGHCQPLLSVNPDTQRTHDIHANQSTWVLEATNYNKSGHA